MHKAFSTTTKNDYWLQVTRIIEAGEARRARRDRIKRFDYSVTLPLCLRKRVAEIIPYEFDEYDRNVFMDDSQFVESNISKDILKDINFDSEDNVKDDSKGEAEEESEKVEFEESKCSEIERLENEFVKFDLKMDKPMEFKVKEKKKVNWCSTYLCKKRKERIKWDSKIYKLDEELAEKTLDEQADVLIEAAAERFSTWVNSLGVNRNTDISMETLKALFTVETDRMLLASLINEPKELKAIAKAVADVWNLPQMALELKYENYIKNRLRKVPKHVQTVQFGRTVPSALRPWVPTAKDDYIKTVFPDEILSGEKLFKGIRHLRSTKALMDFYKRHPKVKKPGFFRRGRGSLYTSEQISKNDVPLYEKLKLIY